jgi:hypothetical protein
MPLRFTGSGTPPSFTGSGHHRVVAARGDELWRFGAGAWRGEGPTGWGEEMSPPPRAVRRPSASESELQYSDADERQREKRENERAEGRGNGMSHALTPSCGVVVGM